MSIATLPDRLGDRPVRWVRPPLLAGQPVPIIHVAGWGFELVDALALALAGGEGRPRPRNYVRCFAVARDTGAGMAPIQREIELPLPASAGGVLAPDTSAVAPRAGEPAAVSVRLAFHSEGYLPVLHEVALPPPALDREAPMAPQRLIDRLVDPDPRSPEHRTLIVRDGERLVLLLGGPQQSLRGTELRFEDGGRIPPPDDQGCFVSWLPADRRPLPPGWPRADLTLVGRPPGACEWRVQYTLDRTASDGRAVPGAVAGNLPGGPPPLRFLLVR